MLGLVDRMSNGVEDMIISLGKQLEGGMSEYRLPYSPRMRAKSNVGQKILPQKEYVRVTLEERLKSPA